MQETKKIKEYLDNVVNIIWTTPNDKKALKGEENNYAWLQKATEPYTPHNKNVRAGLAGAASGAAATGGALVDVSATSAVISGYTGTTGTAAMLASPVAIGAAAGVVGGVLAYQTYNQVSKSDMRHKLSDFLDIVMNGKLTRDKKTWSETVGFKHDINVKNDIVIWESLVSSPKLAELDYADRKKIVNAIPANPEVIETLIKQAFFKDMIPQHYATIFCKIKQIPDSNTKKTDLQGLLKSINAVSEWKTTQGEDSINLTNIKEALRIAQTDDINAISSLHSILKDIKNDATDQQAVWDFIDLQCEKEISKLDQKNILAFNPARDVNLSETDLRYFKQDIAIMTKSFTNLYQNGVLVNKKNDPDSALRHVLSYAKDYQKQVRQVTKRVQKENEDLKKALDKKKNELETVKRNFPDYLKRKEVFERDQQKFNNLTATAPQTPAEIQHLQNELNALDAQYKNHTKYVKRPPEVSAGINIARHLGNSIDFVSNQFIDNPKIGAAKAFFEVATNMSLGANISAFVDDASIAERIQRFKKIFDTSDDISIESIDIDDVNAQINDLENTGISQRLASELIQHIKTPQKNLHDFLDMYQSEDKKLLNFSAQGLDALMSSVLETAFDAQNLSQENFNLLTKLIQKAPKKMFQNKGFFANEKTLVLTQIASDLLSVGAYEPATEFMNALLPKINIEVNDSLNAVDHKIIENFTKITDSALNMANTSFPSAQKLIDLLMNLAEQDFLSNSNNPQALTASVLYTVLNDKTTISSAKKFTLLKNIIEKSPKEMFEQDGFFTEAELPSLVEDLLKDEYMTQASQALEILLPKITSNFDKMIELSFNLAETSNDITAKKPLMLLTDLAKKDIANYNQQNKSLNALTASLIDSAMKAEDPYGNKFNLLKSLIEQSPKEMFQKNGYFAGDNSLKLSNTIYDLLTAKHNEPAAEFMKIVLPKMNIEVNDSLNAVDHKIIENFTKITDSALNMANTSFPSAQKLIDLLMNLAEQDFLSNSNNPQALTASVLYTVLNDKTTISSAKKFTLLKNIIEKSPKEMFEQDGFFTEAELPSLVEDLLKDEYMTQASQALEILLPKITSNFDKMIELSFNLAETSNDITAKKPLMLLTDLAKKDIANYNQQNKSLNALTASLIDSAMKAEDPYGNKFNLLKSLIEQSPKEMFQKNGYFAGDNSLKLSNTIYDLLTAKHNEPAAEFMKIVLPKMNIKENDNLNAVDHKIIENFTKITNLALDMSNTAYPEARRPIISLIKLAEQDLLGNNNSPQNNPQILTSATLNTVMNSDISAAKRFVFLKNILNNAPKEMFRNQGYFSGEKTADLTSLVVDLLDNGYTDKASEALNILLPKIATKHDHVSEVVNKKITANLARITELSLVSALNAVGTDAQIAKESLGRLLHLAKKDVYKSYKYNKQMFENPILKPKHTPYLSRLAFKEIHDNDYKTLTHLIDLVKISNKHAPDNHNKITVQNIFGKHMSVIMDKLITKSSELFNQGPNTSILEILKICDHSDFSKQGILGNNVENLINYTKNASPELQRQILSTNFGHVYQNVFDKKLAAFKGSAKKMHNSFDKPKPKLKKSQIIADDDKSYGSLDSDRDILPQVPKTSMPPVFPTAPKNKPFGGIFSRKKAGMNV